MKSKSIVLLLLLITTVATGCSKNESEFKHIEKSSSQTETIVEAISEGHETAVDSYESTAVVVDDCTIDELVDTKIKELTDSETYKVSSIEEREQLVGPLLKDLEKLGYIKNLYYDKDNETFTFQYYSGVLGGVMIKEWNTIMN